jgi:selenocysteine-specific elongation factor
VRALQSLGVDRPSMGPGNRVAVNLTGVHHDDATRGDALVRSGQWHSTRTFDASLTVLTDLEHDVSRRGAYVAYVGSGEYPVRVRVLADDAITPGATGAVRVHLGVALPLIPGDRYVLRESGRSETVGGGEILDVEPVVRAAQARPDRSVDRVVAERRWVAAGQHDRLTGERRDANAGRWVVDSSELARAGDEIEARVRDAGPLGLDVASLDERQRAVLEVVTRERAVVVQGGRAVASGAADPLAGHPFVVALEAQPFRPPSAAECEVAADELRELVRRGHVIEQDGVWFAPAAVDRAARTIAELLAQHPEGVTVAEVREALDTSRKWAVPLLTQLDASGITRRRGDLRIAGPRLPELSGE